MHLISSSETKMDNISWLYHKASQGISQLLSDMVQSNQFFPAVYNESFRYSLGVLQRLNRLRICLG